MKAGPELRWGLQIYLEAYFDLTTERSHGFGYTSIPWLSIAHYAVFYSFDADQQDRLFTHIRAMDVAHIEKLAAEADAKKAK